MLAIARLGGIVIPINPKFSTKVINNILVKYEATFILSNLKNKKISSFNLPTLYTAPLINQDKIKKNIKINLPKLTDPYIVAIPLTNSIQKLLCTLMHILIREWKERSINFLMT